MVSPFSTDDTTMHKNMESRAPAPPSRRDPVGAIRRHADRPGAPGGADDDDHHHRYKRGEYKEKYWDGACKVERKWKRNGDYSENASAGMTMTTGAMLTATRRGQPWFP